MADIFFYLGLFLIVTLICFLKYLLHRNRVCDRFIFAKTR